MIIPAVIVAALIYGRLSDDADTSRRSTPPATSTQSVVIYRLSGTASRVSITMQNSQGNTEQASDLANNHEIIAGRFPIGEFVYISVQNKGESGSVECAILADGVVISTATSTGAYVIATCSDSVP